MKLKILSIDEQISLHEKIKEGICKQYLEVLLNGTTSAQDICLKNYDTVNYLLKGLYKRKTNIYSEEKLNRSWKYNSWSKESWEGEIKNEKTNKY